MWKDDNLAVSTFNLVKITSYWLGDKIYEWLIFFYSDLNWYLGISKTQGQMLVAPVNTVISVFLTILTPVRQVKLLFSTHKNRNSKSDLQNWPHLILYATCHRPSILFHELVTDCTDYPNKPLAVKFVSTLNTQTKE